jgi:protein-L-isoaspartate O-methyltransferase
LFHNLSLEIARAFTEILGSQTRAMKAFDLTFNQSEKNLFINHGRSAVVYSDGEKEERRLLEIVRSAQDLSAVSWQLHDNATTWVERYHLSVHRGSIIRCLPFPANMQVLEMGAGAGAVTRALGEKFAQVDAIEGSIERAHICARRCRDLPNVRVFAADLDKITPAPQYDLVFLVGVLEWSQGFLAGSNPLHRCLQIASKALKQHGVLVIAIENQLGLKYFLGAGEDHCGTPMEGLHGYPRAGKAKTFSRLELSRLINAGGFPFRQFLYPFPDYKLARVVLTEEAAALGNESIAYWASRHKFEDYQDSERYTYGNQFLVAAEITKAGLLGELSNSFLVLAGKSDSAEISLPWLAWSERLTRNTGLCSTATLERVDNKLQVRKAYPYLHCLKPRDSDSGFSLNPQPEQPFFDGLILEIELLQCAISGRTDDFLQFIADWLDYVREHFKSADGVHIRAEAWDCIPRNLIRLATGELVCFDLEFANNRPFKLENLCGRGLLCWFADHWQWSAGLYPEAKTIRDKIHRLLSTTFTSIEAGNVIDSIVESESTFHRWVNPGQGIDIDTCLDAQIRGADVETSVTSQLRAKQEELARLQEHAARLQLFSDSVRRTLAYRVYRKFIKPFKFG